MVKGALGIKLLLTDGMVGEKIPFSSQRSSLQKG
jgi:hypothetical protein